MASFGETFINQLTNPGYSRGMFDLGASIGAAPGRARAAQFDTDVTQTQYQGDAAARQGDIAALSMRKQQLINMLGSAPNEEARANLKNAIAELNNMTASTEQLAKQNQIDSVIEMEKAINDKSVPEAARKAFEGRIKALNKDPDVRKGVVSKKFDVRYQTLTNNFKMQEAKFNSDVAQLDAAGYGTKAFENIAASGQVSQAAVDASKKKALERQALMADYQKQIDDKTWTADKANTLRKNEIPVTGDVQADLAAWKQVVQGQANNVLAKIENDAGPLSATKAEALVRLTLDSIAESGDVPFEAPWADDIEESIMEVMTPEDKQTLAQSVEGMNSQDAVAYIEQYLRDKFPDAWLKSKKRLEKNKFEENVLAVLVANNLADTPENRERAKERLRKM